MKLSCTTSEIQLELKALLKAFDHICRVEHIEYSLHAGTLLGAIREKGFIPWDNDADILMSRASFNQLISVIGKYNEYMISEYDLLPKFVRSRADSSCPFGWIDIFICDYISENRITQHIKIITSLLMRLVYRDKDMTHLADGNGHNFIFILISRLLSIIGGLIPKSKKKEWINTFCASKMIGKKQCVYRSNDYWRGMKIVEPQQYLHEFIDIEFEDITLRASSHAHGILKDSYGADYMIPKRDQAAVDRHEDDKIVNLYKYVYNHDETHL